jgi:hypothetical protein
LLTSDETNKGETWSVAVTPADGLDYGTTTVSNSLTIQSTQATVQLISPNSSWVVDDHPVFECTASSQDAEFVNVSVFLNESGTWGEYLVNTSVSGTDVTWHQNKSGLAENTYIWTCRACDAEGDCWWASENRTLTVDTTDPSISYAGPTPSDGITIATTTSPTINITSSDDHTNHSVVLDWNNSLVGWWSFDNVSGTTIVDKSSYTNDASIISAYQSEGYYGKGMHFNGVDSIVDAGSDSEFGFTTFTVETWAKIDSYHTNTNIGQVLFDGYNTYVGYLFYLDGPNAHIGLRLHNGSQTCASVESSTDIQVNEWHHFVGTYNGSVVSVYVDGVLKNTGTCLDYYPYADLVLGSFSESSSFFNGTMDEARVYNRALSPAEINASYDASRYRYTNTFSSLGEGSTYSYTAHVIDQAGNMQETASRTLSVNNKPSVSSLVLNSTSLNNLTTDNLSVTFSQADTDGDTVVNTTDWRLGGVSIATVNMPFNVNVSTTTTDAVTDLSTFSYDGTLGYGNSSNAPTYTTDCLVGGCYQYDGSEDYIQVTAQAITPDYTSYSIWFKPAESGESQRVYSLVSSLSGNGANPDLGTHGRSGMTVDPGGSISAAFSVYGCSRYQEVSCGGYYNIEHNGSCYGSYNSVSTTGGSFSVGTWHHAVAVHDYLLVNVTLYVDGQRVSSAENLPTSCYEFSGSDMTLNQTPCLSMQCDEEGLYEWLGRRKGSGSTNFNGTIDEFLKFNRSISSQEVATIYAAGQAGTGVKTLAFPETNVGETWTVVVFPADGYEYGSAATSNSLTIIEPSCTIDSEITLVADLDCSGETLTITNTGTLNAGSYDVLADTASIDGTLTSGSGSVNISEAGGMTIEDEGIVTMGTGTDYLSGLTMVAGSALTLSSGETKVSGDWDTSASDFTHSNGLVNFTESSNLKCDGSYQNPFYSVAMAAAGKTTTLQSTIWIYGDLRLGSGTLTDGTGSTHQLYYSGVSGRDYYDDGATLNFNIFNYRGTDTSVLSRDYTGVQQLYIYPPNAKTYTLEGDIICKNMKIFANLDPSTTVLDTAGYDVNCTNDLILGNNAQNGWKGEFWAGTGTHHFGNMTIYNGTYNGGTGLTTFDDVTVGTSGLLNGSTNTLFIQGTFDTDGAFKHNNGRVTSINLLPSANTVQWGSASSSDWTGSNAFYDLFVNASAAQRNLEMYADMTIENTLDGVGNVDLFYMRGDNNILTMGTTSNAGSILLDYLYGYTSVSRSIIQAASPFYPAIISSDVAAATLLKTHASYSPSVVILRNVDVQQDISTQGSGKQIWCEKNCSWRGLFIDDTDTLVFNASVNASLDSLILNGTLYAGDGILTHKSNTYWEADFDNADAYSFSSTTISYGNNTGSKVIDARNA